jgi:hypothetical protein
MKITSEALKVMMTRVITTYHEVQNCKSQVTLSSVALIHGHRILVMKRHYTRKSSKSETNTCGRN